MNIFTSATAVNDRSSSLWAMGINSAAEVDWNHDVIAPRAAPGDCLMPVLKTETQVLHPILSLSRESSRR